MTNKLNIKLDKLAYGETHVEVNLITGQKLYGRINSVKNNIVYLDHFSYTKSEEGITMLPRLITGVQIKVNKIIDIKRVT